MLFSEFAACGKLEATLPRKVACLPERRQTKACSQAACLQAACLQAACLQASVGRFFLIFQRKMETN